MVDNTFPNEIKIKRIGGKLYEDYLSFKKEVDYINIYYFEFFSLLGLTDDINCIIEALQSHKVEMVFFEKVARDISEGRIPKEEFISPPTIQYAKRYAFTDPEKVMRREQRSIRYNIKLKYKEIGEKFLEENKMLPFNPRHNKKALEICGGSLYVTPEQIAIDVNKFIDIYSSYLSALKSETNRLHQHAADAMNQFFNGVEITQKELERYFTLEAGVINVKPKSVSKIDYARLGWRCFDGDVTTPA